MATVLETVGLEKRFGGITATSNVSLKIEKGARHALIGPNGAGKTTLINLVTGVLQPTAGQILLEGQDITRLQSYQRVHLGMARTFQINQLFPDMTPVEAIGLAVSERLGLGGDWWRLAGTRPERLLEIALAIACRPRVLLLDEPAAGVPEGERRDILAAIAALPKDVTVLLIEHDMDLVFTFADRISVLVNGALFADGLPREISRDPRVKAVYLGESLDA